MSLKEPFPAAIPEDTQQLVEPLLALESVYRVVGQEIAHIISDEDFVGLYADEGRPGINPVVLALVTVFQFLEKLPDRAAAQMAVLRMDWKYALHQPLDWTGFHYSDLCNFRKRLLAHAQEGQVFERVVNYLREKGYMKAGGKQRTDSTHIIGAVRTLSTLDLVWETIRVVVSALISADAPWVLKQLPASFVETYTQRPNNYRMSKQEIVEALQQAARDGEWLLEHIACSGIEPLSTLPEGATLRRVLDEQFVQSEETLQFTPTGHYRGNFIATPHDLDAHRSVKRSTHWVGYKLHVTESIGSKTQSGFITDVAITPAPDADNQHVEPIRERLDERQVLPAKQYVDQGYMSAANVADSHQQGVDLRGRLLPDTSGKPEGFRLADFQVDMQQRQAICPAGHHAARFVPAKPNPRNLVAYHVFFGKQCRTCSFFGPGLCTDKLGGRHLSLNLHHDLIQARRREEQTKTFAQEMYQRAAIEGTISELVRAHGARRSRYRGTPKNQLQAFFTAAAVNLKRLARSVALCFARFGAICHTASRLLAFTPIVFQQNRV